MKNICTRFSLWTFSGAFKPHFLAFINRYRLLLIGEVINRHVDFLPVFQSPGAPCEKHHMADASSRELLSQAECESGPSSSHSFRSVCFPSACFVFQFLRSPPTEHSLLYGSFYNKNSFPMAEQQLMHHLDTTHAARAPIEQHCLSISLSFYCLALSRPPFILRISFDHSSSRSAFTETSSRRISSSPNTRSSNSVTLALRGFSVSSKTREAL